MGEKISDALAAPVTLVLGGAEYELSELTNDDWAALERWLRGRPLANAKELIEDNPTLTSSERGLLLTEAAREGRDISLTSPGSAKALVSLDGARLIFYLTARHKTKGLTKAKVAEIITLDNEAEVNEQIDLAMGGRDAESGEAPAEDSPQTGA